MSEKMRWFDTLRPFWNPRFWAAWTGLISTFFSGIVLYGIGIGSVEPRLLTIVALLICLTLYQSRFIENGVKTDIFCYSILGGLSILAITAGMVASIDALWRLILLIGGVLCLVATHAQLAPLIQGREVV